MTTSPIVQKQLSHVCHFKMQTHKTQEMPLVHSHNYSGSLCIRTNIWGIRPIGNIPHNWPACTAWVTLAVHGQHQRKHECVISLVLRLRPKHSTAEATRKKSSCTPAKTRAIEKDDYVKLQLFRIRALKQEDTCMKSCNCCAYVNRCVTEYNCSSCGDFIILRSWVVNWFFWQSSAVQLDVFKTDHNEELCRCFPCVFNRCENKIA